MTGVWIVAVGVVVLDVLIARQIVVEYRRYQLRRSMRRMEAALHDLAVVIGTALLPTIRTLVTMTAALAKALDGEKAAR